MAIYDIPAGAAPLENHIQTLANSADAPEITARPDFGLDSALGLLASNVAAPLYLYASLKGKFQVWDGILNGLPNAIFRGPVLDVGCGRGMVLLKIAERKKTLLSTSSSDGETVAPVYGIDLFFTRDQTGNSPVATYKNAAAMGVVQQTVLHTADFTKRFPFVDGAFSLITSSLALHNAKKPGRIAAIREMARVCAPGGRIVIVDLHGYFGYYRAALEELGWKGVDVSLVGFKMMFGILPCQMLTATKPSN